MSDYPQGLPVRSEADGTDNRVQVKIVDGSTPSQKATVDTDNALKVLATGHDGSNVNRPLLTSTTGQLHVLVDSTNADISKVLNYNTASAVASLGTSNHTYTVTVGKTLSLSRVICSASARAKWELKTGPAGSETTKAVLFTSVATQNAEFKFDLDQESIEVAATNNVLLVRTNEDNQAQDMYSTIIGIEK